MTLDNKQVYDKETITVSSSAVTLSATKLANVQTGATSGREYAFASTMTRKASGVIIEVLSQPIYYTLDGSTPTSTNGHTLVAGDTLPIVGYQKCKSLKMIRQSADATVFVS